MQRMPSGDFGVARTFKPLASQAFDPFQGADDPKKAAPAYDAEGAPCFENKHQARDFAKKHGMKYGERG